MKDHSRMALHHILAEPRRPPSGLDLDLSLHSDMAIALAKACLGTCMVFESCPLEREGPLGCGHVCHTLIACHGEASSCVVGLAACAPIPEVSFSCLLILVRLASWANMHGFSSS